jgi:hypothetical protein
VLIGSANRDERSGTGRLYLALAPFVLGSLLARAARFVVTGSVLKLGAPDPIAGHVWIGFKPARHAKVIDSGIWVARIGERRVTEEAEAAGVSK